MSLIPPKPRDKIELNKRYLRTILEPSKNIIDKVEVIIGVTTHGSNLNLGRCLDSIVSQKIDSNLGVVILIDKTGPPVSLAGIPKSLENYLWILQVNCGSSARSRNTIIEFVEREVSNSKWIARMDGDDRFANKTSLSTIVKTAEDKNANYVLGGNNVLDKAGNLKRVNSATKDLKNSQWLLNRLQSMANYTASNEIPSCNLLVSAKSGIRYPDMRSAEDHWLVVDLLINKSDEIEIETEVMFADYTENGGVSLAEKETGRHQKSRISLLNAAKKWVEINSKDGMILGLGQEGIVNLNSGNLTKYFYSEILNPKKATWLSKVILNSQPYLPNAKIQKLLKDKTYKATYPFENSENANNMNIEMVSDFLLFCLDKNIVCSNIKRTNLRIFNRNTLSYIDIGNSIIPMNVSYFRDSAARLYAIGILGWSDWELLRRPTDSSRTKIWDNLPGFSKFYGELIEKHLKSLTSKPKSHIQKKSINRDEVTLLIKACAMDSEYAESQIIHIVDQLTMKTNFKECVLSIDSYEGPFLRQHNNGDLAKLEKTAHRLKSRGVINRFLISPKSSSQISKTNYNWFGLQCYETHTKQGVPVFSQLWAFDQIQSRYVLQCDVDILVGKYDSNHDVIGDMIRACEKDNALSVGFNIAHDRSAEFKNYWAPKGEFVPEVRCCLLDLNRIRSCLPLPNKVTDGKLDKTWYRSLQQYQYTYSLRSLRGGSPFTFYIHPPNSIKDNSKIMPKIRDLVSQGLIPPSQQDCWDLVGEDGDWKYPSRNEDIILLARGRNTSSERLKRFSDSLYSQKDQDFGLIVIDDASNTIAPSELRLNLEWLGNRLTLIRNNEKKGRMVNHVVAVSQYCKCKDSLITILDLDDALFGKNVISKLRKLRKKRHDVILGAPFLPDRPTKIYHPSFDKARERWGGDVWIHLRSFTKELFDKIPLNYYKLNGTWVDKCTDYATMVPIVELAKNPIYLPEYLCWHKRTTKMNPESRIEYDWTIKKILAKPGMKF